MGRVAVCSGLRLRGANSLRLPFQACDWLSKLHALQDLLQMRGASEMCCGKSRDGLWRFAQAPESYWTASAAAFSIMPRMLISPV